MVYTVIIIYRDISLWIVIVHYFAGVNKLYVLSTHCIHAVYTYRRVLSCEWCWKYFHDDEMILCFLKSQSEIISMLVVIWFYFDFLEKWKSQLLLWKYFRSVYILLTYITEYYPVNGVNKLYEYTIICFAGVRKVYTTCIYTAYTLHTQSQRYIFAMV